MKLFSWFKKPKRCSNTGRVLSLFDKALLPVVASTVDPTPISKVVAAKATYDAWKEDRKVCGKEDRKIYMPRW